MEPFIGPSSDFWDLGVFARYPIRNYVLARGLAYAARLRSLNSGTVSFKLKNLTALPASIA